MTPRGSPRPGHSTVATFDVLGGLRILRVEEQVLSAAMLDEFALEHEDAFVAGPPGLGHVVRHDDNGAAVLERAFAVSAI